MLDKKMLCIFFLFLPLLGQEEGRGPSSHSSARGGVGVKQTGKISIVFEDLVRNLVIF